MQLKSHGKKIYFVASLICAVFVFFTGLLVFSPNVETDQYDNPIFWDTNDIPLIISMNYASEPKHINAMRDAISMWNDSIGREVFIGPEIIHFHEDEIGEDPYSHAIFSYPVEEVGIRLKTRLYATAKKYYSIIRRENGSTETKINSCKINFLRETRQDILTNVFIHELGHCVGFNHDWNNRSSIMFPIIFEETRYQYITEIHKQHLTNMFFKSQAL